MNGIDINPLTGESLGRMGMGPCRKNFVMPKELDTKLTANFMNGKASLKLPKRGIVLPAELIGKNPSTVIVIANEMWTLIL